VIINKGEIVYNGNVEHIKNSYSNERNIIITFGEEIMEEELSTFGKMVVQKNREVRIRSALEDIASIKKEILSKYEVIDFRIEEVDIEDAIAKMIKNK
jgi:ABC-2 type transport system ATP-binding protein